jgi:hypothetical protein
MLQFSNGWLVSFLKRHGFSSRRATTVCQKPPEFYVEKIIDFLLYVERLITMNNYDKIFACDETAVYLDCSNSLTVADRGSKQVSTLKNNKLNVSISGFSENHGTREIACYSNAVRSIRRF